MPDEATIEATMQVYMCSREDALKHLALFESTDDDKELARFLVDLFDHHKFDYDRFERCFWRDNEAMAKSSHPQWSQRQRKSIEMMQETYLPRMYREPA